MRQLILSFKRFTNNEQGSVLILFGLAVLFLVGIGGAAIDLGRQQLTSVKMQQAADAAATSAGSLSNPDGSPLSNADLNAAATRYFNLNYPIKAGSGDERPGIIVDTTSVSGNLTVTAQTQTMTTSFVGNLGFPTLTSNGASTVGISSSALSDYDVVIIDDESGSEGGMDTGNGETREQTQQDALRVMTDAIIPADKPNPNVRMGFIGFTGRIVDKWGLSSSNADAKQAISGFQPLYQNFDHVALLGAQNMLQGGTGGTVSGQNLSDYSVPALNTDMPPPRGLPRTNPSDANGLSPTKYVVFLSDGGIMIEPSDDSTTDSNYDKSTLVHKHCNGRAMDNSGTMGFGYSGTGGYNECFAAFTDACTQLKNTGGTDNVHVIIVNLVTFVTDGETAALTNCASPTLPGGDSFTSGEKPDPSVDFFYASDAAEEAKILSSVTKQIKSVRISK